MHILGVEREEKKIDRRTGRMRMRMRMRMRDLIREDLISSLKEFGIKEPKGSKKKLQELAKRYNLPMKHEQRVIDEGWVGKVCFR